MSAEQNKNNKWVWIGLGAAALFCLCAVGAMLLVFYGVGRQVADGTSTDPDSAAKAAHEITDYDLPPGYQEQVAMDLFVYEFVMIGPSDTGNNSFDPVIMLAQFQTGAADKEQMEEQIRQSFEQQSGRRGMDMHLVEIKDMLIRGEEVPVAIYEGTDENGLKFRQLITTFTGKNGTAMLMVMGPAAGWDQSQIDEFIESLR